MRHWPTLTALVLVLLVIAAGAPAAEAARGPCIPGTKGPKCHIWTGKAKAIDDGDTLNARVRGVGRIKIRVTGIQAMELTRYGKKRGRRGECHSVEAAVAFERLIRRGRSRIRIAAIKPNSSTGERGRLRRSVAVKIGGRWVDPAAELLKRGLALWFPNAAEWAWNKPYGKLAAQAAARGIGIWDTDACGGARASQDTGPLPMKVKWDAAGVDGRNLNGEWARISNPGVLPIDIGGWWFRDSHLRRFRLPGNAVIPPGSSIQIHAGRGEQGPSDFYWGLRETVFENVTGGRRGMGDGGYLFDRRGNLRSWMQYPCRFRCGDPAKGAVRIDATARGTESVKLTNTSQRTIDLREYEVESRPYFFELTGALALLAPGQSITIWISDGPGAEGPRELNWGSKQPLLADRRDMVTLRNRYGHPVTCDAWGRGFRCPRF